MIIRLLLLSLLLVVFALLCTRRQTSKSIANLIARGNKYRPDLRAAAVARASAIISTQQPKKVQKKRESKGVRAIKA
ncbi:hypothetical protein G6F56_012679 [Rhizopus delemar]|nr:hypothetical protein G6F56_012679 [Rhizopus delemar]